MAWSTVTLSTLNSIALHEGEINNLAQSYTRNSITVAAGATFSVLPDRLDNIYVINSAGGQEKATYNTGTHLHTITTATMLISCYDATDGIVFPFLAGTGSPQDTTDTFILTMVSGMAWGTYDATGTWANKITLAKDLIALKLKKALADHAILDRYTTSGEALDYLTDTDMLNIPSDYMVLHLIYTDLFNATFREAYQIKADYYLSMFNARWGEALPLVLYTYGKYR